MPLKNMAAGSALASMLKMMGIDPEQITQMAGAVQADVKRIADSLQSLDQRMARIEAKLGIEGEAKDGTGKRASAAASGKNA